MGRANRLIPRIHRPASHNPAISSYRSPYSVHGCRSAAKIITRSRKLRSLLAVEGAHEETSRMPSREEIVAALTASGPLELTTDESRGYPMRVYRNGPASLREVLLATRAHGERPF